MNDITIRQETEKDYKAVEELTREAFCNVYKPGADEHYFVNQMRNHPDFISSECVSASNSASNCSCSSG